MQAAPAGNPFPKLNLSPDINLHNLETREGVIEFWERGHMVHPHYINAADVECMKSDLNRMKGKPGVISGEVFLFSFWITVLGFNENLV